MNTWIKDSDCFVFCYDMTNRSSIEDVLEIIQLAQRHKERDIHGKI